MVGTDPPFLFADFACPLCQEFGRAFDHVCVLSGFGSGCVVMKEEGVENDDAALGFVDVWIDTEDSLAGNPFERPRQQSILAFEELLRFLLLGDLDFDRLTDQYIGMLDERRSHVTDVLPIEKTLILEIAGRHRITKLRAMVSERFRAVEMQSWLCHHVKLLWSGASLRLRRSDPTISSLRGSSHVLVLVGALTWAATHLRAPEPNTV